LSLSTPADAAIAAVTHLHVKGASVSSVARRHEVNPNQVFAWRQLHRRGLLDSKAVPEETAMLSVRVSTPTVLPIKPAMHVGKAARPERTSKLIEIRLANGHSVVLRGRVDAKTLARVLGVLVRQ
jgi:transposase-like protein